MMFPKNIRNLGDKWVNYFLHMEIKRRVSICWLGKHYIKCVLGQFSRLKIHKVENTESRTPRPLSALLSCNKARLRSQMIKFTKSLEIFRLFFTSYGPIRYICHIYISKNSVKLVIIVSNICLFHIRSIFLSEILTSILRQKDLIAFFFNNVTPNHGYL